MNEEKSVQVMCPNCSCHISGAIAGTHVRWEKCWRCQIDPSWHFSFPSHLSHFFYGIKVWWKYRKWRALY